MPSLKRFLKILRWKMINVGPRRDITLDTWNGRLTFDSRDWLIGKYLYINRAYEADNIGKILPLLEREGLLKLPGDVFIDVGANIGMIAIAMLKHHRFRRAIAIEPEPNNFRLLQKNVMQNNLLQRIQCFPYAVSSTEARAHFELSPDNFGDHRVRNESSNKSGFFREEKRTIIEVQLKTMDQLCDETDAVSLDQVSLVWVDIQGHEGHFFAGAKRLLQHRQVPVVSEFWPYAIQRSGITPEHYSQIVSELFTHFYWFNPKIGQFEKRPVADIRELFHIYDRPRRGDQVVFIHHNSDLPHTFNR